MNFLTLDTHEWWVLLTAIACAVACAIPGCFLVLKRMSMLGDAISHAILPGLALAFLLTGSRDVLPMLLGAMALGVVTALLTSGLARLGRVPEDTSMGVVFTTLFALGVILLSFGADRVDLDANCVFYGLLEGVAEHSNMRSVLGVAVPRAFLILGGAMLLNIALAAAFWKELKITAFDPALAVSMGISAAAVHYGLMSAVAATTVVSFEAVGSILVIAMLIAPGAAAHLLTDRLWRMVLLAAIIAACSAVAGFLAALHLGTTIAGPMSVAAGLAFLLAALFSPRHGVVARLASQFTLGLRIAREDLLGILFRAEESGQHVTTADARRALGRPTLTRLALLRARAAGLLHADAAHRLSLTPAGREAAARVVRTHRLWETYLTSELGIPLDHVHDPSHRIEHFISHAVERDLSSRVAHAEDPHGKPIPGHRAD